MTAGRATWAGGRHDPVGDIGLELARTVADAVLYEGYLLYPYRATSAKNRVRWQFGVLGPPGAASAGIGEESWMQAECLLRVDGDAALTVHLRCLQLQARTIEQADPTGPDGFTAVDELHVGGTHLLSWDEAVERSVTLGPYASSDLAPGLDTTVEIAGGQDGETVTSADGRTVARVVRRRWPLVARVHLRTTPVDARPGVVRLSVRVDNTSAPDTTDRDEATRRSLLGAHLLLQATSATFVSLLEPPPGLEAAASACDNRRCWPVLVGVEGQTDLVLVSPIILYDYPAVAPESAGALFDSTEIDEILTLRVMTLTDDEKAAARATDPAAAAIIDRCEQMSPAAMQQLHGILRSPSPPGREGSAPVAAGPLRPGTPPGVGTAGGSLDDVPTLITPGQEGPSEGRGTPWWDPGVDASVSPTTDVVMIAGTPVTKGSRVRLHPKRSADAQDLFYADRVATVAAVYFDVDGQTHVAVVLVDDPAADLHDRYGRYLYFAPDEIQPLDRPPGAVSGTTQMPGTTEEDKTPCEPSER